MAKYYTGVGSRETPVEVLIIMNKIALFLAKHNFIVRHGNAKGADKAFDISPKEVYLPWNGFEGGYVDYKEYFLFNPKAYEYIDLCCLHFNNLTQGGQKLHLRNIHQVLGRDLKTPSKFLICWTPNGKVQRGTATAIKLAEIMNIPVLNLGLYNINELELIINNFFNSVNFYDINMAQGDIFELSTPNDIICITTNGMRNKHGEAIMGKGIALSFKNKYPNLPKILGEKLINGNQVYDLGVFDGKRIFSFPTKYDWRNKSSLELIEESCKQLLKLTETCTNKIYIPMPGCANGGLTIHQVAPILEKYFYNPKYIIIQN